MPRKLQWCKRYGVVSDASVGLLRMTRRCVIEKQLRMRFGQIKNGLKVDIDYKQGSAAKMRGRSGEVGMYNLRPRRASQGNM